MPGEWWLSQKELDSAQLEIIELSRDGNHLLVGPPGSGKTNLLLLRANHLFLSGFKNLRIIVFTRSLRDFILRGGTRYDFPASRVLTSTGWQYEFLREFGKAQPALNLPFEQARAELLEKVRTLISEKAISQPYEAILIDEGQDYWQEELDIFTQLSSRVFVAFDSRQQIYSGGGGIDFLESRGFAKHELSFHYRNGIAICRYADALAKYAGQYPLLAETSNYDNERWPSRVQMHATRNLEEQAKKITEELTKQLQAYPDDLLGVVCPRHMEVDYLRSHLINTPLADALMPQEADDVFSSTDPEKRIFVGTIHSAKGLEFRALHVAGADTLRRFPLQRNMAFTVTTRAKTSLDFYVTGDWPSYLDQANTALLPPPEPPPIEMAFGRQ